ncbi:MAG: glycoside hydrolase family 9 protein [Chloroflexi bacterium]|nr:glycoside hydrolase family 9 protein [Chloroflexota bacterium]
MHEAGNEAPRSGKRRGGGRLSRAVKIFAVIACLMVVLVMVMYRVTPAPLPEQIPEVTQIPQIQRTPIQSTPAQNPQPTPIPPTPQPTPTYKYNYAEALQKSLYFYEVQRSGRLPANNRVAWRGDSALEDGADNGVDLTGGWYDAGDAVKFGFPMAASATMLAWGMIEYRDAYVQSGQWTYTLDNLRWATDYFVKAHTAPNELWAQVGDGDIDHDWWGPAEVMSMPRPSSRIDQNCPGSDLAAETAAALATASIVFKPVDANYADKLLEHAGQLYTFADTFQGQYSDCIKGGQTYYKSHSGYWDELVWGALWLYRATEEPAYLAKAESYYKQLDAPNMYTFTQSWDDKRYGCYALLAMLTGNASYAEDTERWLDYWSVGYEGRRIAYTPGGLAWANRWGVLRYAANTAFIAFVYSDAMRDPAKKARYHDFAVSQINYILGDNPRQSSYVVGFGNNPPSDPAHRNAHGSWMGKLDVPPRNRHVPYGALIGGPDQNDQFVNDRADYVTNEVATDYNAAFTGALARMVSEFGGQPLQDFPPPEPRDAEFFVEASTSRAGFNAIQIHAFLNNRSGWPPRVAKDLSFRYFIDLSEVLSSGHTLDDVQITLDSADGARMSPLQPWTEDAGMYFVEVDFRGIPISPGGEGSYRKEVWLTISLPDGTRNTLQNTSRQWSLQELTESTQTTPYLPVYENGKRLYGQEPGAPP